MSRFSLRNSSGTSEEELKKKFKHRTDVAVAHVFLRYTDKHIPRDMYASLLGQIIKANAAAFAAIQPFILGCKDQDGKLSEMLTQSELIEALQTATQPLAKAFIVIDGLDEASDVVKNSLLRELPAMGLNLLIMSRPLELFKSHTPHAMSVNIQARTHDIDLLVRRRATESATLQAILKDDPRSIANLSARVIKKSEGM